MSNSATSTYETERKYEIADAAALPDPAGLAGLDSGAGAREQQMAAVYFDTEDLGLLRAGVTLRRREGGNNEGWHLKLPAGRVGEDTREEIRLPLGRAGRTPPAELVGLTRLYSRGAALAPVAELTTHRRRWVYADGRGRELAELVEDEVDAHTMGSETSAMSWREVEVELAEHGRVKLLDRIERELLRGGAHRSRSGSKLGRVLADRLTAAPAGGAASDGGAAKGPVKAGSAGAELLAYLAAQADQLRAQDPLVRRDAPDAVHKMRVAARRMRSALQAYRRVLDRSVTDGLVDELKWLGGELSEARDSEVIEERLVDVVGSLPDELVLGPVSAQVTRALQRRRATGREQATAALDSDRYLALHDTIDRLLADPPLTGWAGRPARSELPRGVARAWRRTVKRMRAAQRTEPGPGRDTALHETRKAAKRLRYAVEVAAPSVGKPARRLKRRLKGLHTVLGAHQDAVVARPVIRELATTARYEGGNGFTYGVLHGREHGRADRAERRVGPAWQRVRRAKNVKWVRS